MVEVCDREIITNRITSSCLSVPSAFTIEPVSPLSIPLLLGLRRVLMNLLMDLARIQIGHSYRAILRHTHQVTALLVASRTATSIRNEHVSYGGALMGVYQQDRGDAVVGDLLIFTRGCVFEHLEQEDATVVCTQEVTRLLRRDIDS
jgi:hypothetical protein